MQKIKDYIYYNRKEIITAVICMFILLVVIFYKNNTNPVTEVLIEKDLEEKNEEENESIFVDIKGEVNNPGTYEFSYSDRIKDAIKKCGGLTKKANVNNINLSEKLKDEMLIIIPSIDDNEKKQNDKNIDSNNQIKSEKNIQVDNKISINTASINELTTIKGIGKAKAEAIINYRNNNGLFKNINDITKVSGIGTSTFEKIKDYIKL